MRRRRQVLGAALLMTVTAGASTAMATHRADAADRRARATALAGLQLQVVPPEEAVDAPTFDRRADPVYTLRVRNAGSAGIVVRSAAWRGHVVPVDTAVDPGQDQVLVLPQPTGCPAHRVTESIDHVDVGVAALRGERTLRLRLPDPLGPAVEINTRCGLHPAAESVQAAVRAVRARPGHVVLDVSLAFSGTRPTQLLGLRSAAGVSTSVAERLPLTLPGAPELSDGRGLPHVLTITLRLRDCGALVPSLAQGPVEDGVLPAPGYDQLQLEVRHPGEPVEQVDLGYPTDAANALASSCDVPPLDGYEGS